MEPEAEWTGVWEGDMQSWAWPHVSFLHVVHYESTVILKLCSFLCVSSVPAIHRLHSLCLLNNKQRSLGCRTGAFPWSVALLHNGNSCINST